MVVSLPSVALFSDSPGRGELIQSAIDGRGAGKVSADKLTALRWVERIEDLLNDAIPAECLIVDLLEPADTRLSACLELITRSEKPVVLFVEFDDQAFMRQAIDAGAAAYVIKGLNADRIRQVTEMAMQRFAALGRLRAEVTEAKEALAGRDSVDRAKRLLIKTRGLTEPEAYALLRKTAMNQNCRIHEVADSLLMSASLLGE